MGDDTTDPEQLDQGRANPKGVGTDQRASRKRTPHVRRDEGESVNAATKISSGTLMPISLIISLLSVAFWVGGLAKDIAANAAETDRLEAQIESADIQSRNLEHDVIDEISKQTAAISELKSQAAATDAKVDILLKWGQAERSAPRKPTY